MGNKGRHFRAWRLYDTVTVRMAGGMIREKPFWYNVVNKIPPSEILVRTRPVQLNDAPLRTRLPKDTFRPQQLVYEEDTYRRMFYKDHPWELARPRVIVERDGKDARHYDWSKGLRQPRLPLSGESVAQRMMWLVHNEGITPMEAYDITRKEFYALRHREEIEVRVQREESRHVGGYYGPSQLVVGEKLEDKAFEEWKRWAQENIERAEAARAASRDVLVAQEEDAELEAEIAEEEIRIPA